VFDVHDFTARRTPVSAPEVKTSTPRLKYPAAFAVSAALAVGTVVVVGTPLAVPVKVNVALLSVQLSVVDGVEAGRAEAKLRELRNAELLEIAREAEANDVRSRIDAGHLAFPPCHDRPEADRVRRIVADQVIDLYARVIEIAVIRTAAHGLSGEERRSCEVDGDPVDLELRRLAAVTSGEERSAALREVGIAADDEVQIGGRPAQDRAVQQGDRDEIASPRRRSSPRQRGEEGGDSRGGDLAHFVLSKPTCALHSDCTMRVLGRLSLSNLQRR
jgi:hypothetical protein